jgi:hypothetical protein
MKFILYLLFISIFFFHCTKKTTCPPDQILGSLALETDSKRFLPYSGIMHLEFTDDSGHVAYLEDLNGLISDSSHTIIENICLEDELRSDKYFISEHKTINFFDLDTSRKFRVIGNLTILEDNHSKSSTVADPVIFDELKLTVHRSNPSKSGAVATIEYITNDRGNFARFSDSTKLKNETVTFIPSVTINSYTYDNVFEVHKKENKDSVYFYFKPDNGVVAFRDLNNKWWNLTKAY